MPWKLKDFAKPVELDPGCRLYHGSPSLIPQLEGPIWTESRWQDAAKYPWLGGKLVVKPGKVPFPHLYVFETTRKLRLLDLNGLSEHIARNPSFYDAIPNARARRESQAGGFKGPKVLWQVLDLPGAVDDNHGDLRRPVGAWLTTLSAQQPFDGYVFGTEVFLVDPRTTLRERERRVIARDEDGQPRVVGPRLLTIADLSDADAMVARRAIEQWNEVAKIARRAATGLARVEEAARGAQGRRMADDVVSALVRRHDQVSDSTLWGVVGQITPKADPRPKITAKIAGRLTAMNTAATAAQAALRSTRAKASPEAYSDAMVGAYEAWAALRVSAQAVHDWADEGQPLRQQAQDLGGASKDRIQGLDGRREGDFVRFITDAIARHPEQPVARQALAPTEEYLESVMAARQACPLLKSVIMRPDIEAMIRGEERRHEAARRAGKTNAASAAERPRRDDEAR